MRNPNLVFMSDNSDFSNLLYAGTEEDYFDPIEELRLLDEAMEAELESLLEELNFDA